MEAVKVPQNLEIKDVLLWGLGAVDLVCAAVGGVLAWWLYLAVPGPVVLRAALATPVLAIGLGLAMGHIQERSLREWVMAIVAYAARPRRQLYGR